MNSIEGIGLDEVTAAYGGPQADLYALLFGQQLHIGGMNASLDLARRAGIGAGMKGIDLCCGNGAGMRALVRFCDVAAMTGVEATARNVDEGQARCRKEALDHRIRFLHADATDCGLESASADFVWGEDAWCYVVDKPKLIAEAARLVRKGGTIAFTDWVEGPAKLSDDEAARFLGAMNFANLFDTHDYEGLLSQNGCGILVAEDTGRIAAYFDLFIAMIEMQLTYDVLATVAFRMELLKAVTDGFRFLAALAHAGKIMQARFIAQRS